MQYSRWIVIAALATLALPGLVMAQDPPTAPAAPPELGAGRLDVSGSFFSRYEVRRGYAQAPVIGDEPASDLVRYRARIGLDVDVLESDTLDLGVRFVPQTGGFWHVGGNELADPALGVHEAAIDFQTGPFDFEVGRFEMVYGDHLVIGNVGWHHLGRAFDGARVRTIAGEAWIDVFFTILDEGFADVPVAEPFGAGDTYFTGVYAGLGRLFRESDLDLDLYVLSRIWPGADDIPPPEADEEPLAVERDGAADVTPGARVKGKIGVLDFRAEQGLQLGTRPDPVGPNAIDVFAYQGDVEIGVDFREQAHTRVAAEAFYASGDDPDTPESEAYDHLYPTAHKWIGLMDLVGPRSNVYGGIGHVQLAFSPVSVQIDTHVFFRPEPADDDPYLGTEVDAGVAWAIAKPLKLRGLYGIFVPEEGDPRQFVELALEANF